MLLSPPFLSLLVPSPRGDGNLLLLRFKNVAGDDDADKARDRVRHLRGRRDDR